MIRRAYYATKKNPNAIFINQQWLNEHGPSPYYLDQPGETYILKTNVSTPGTAFVIIKDNIKFDLGGNTIIYDNAVPIAVPNGSFEEGTGDLADGWDFTNAANAHRLAGSFLDNQIFLGDHSLRFMGHTGTEEVITEDIITLEANTQYSFSAMFSNKSWQGGVGLRIYAKLVGQNNANVYTIQKTSSNNRGMELVDLRIVTGGTPETYKVVAGSDNPPGKVDYQAIVDDIQVQRSRCYGITANITGARLNAGWYPGVTRTGAALNAVIRDGEVIQGQDKALGSRSILCYSCNGDISNMTISCNGDNSSAVDCQWAQGSHLHHCTIHSDTRAIKSRDSFDGAIVSTVQGSIHDNIITGGCHTALLTIGAASHIYGNIINHKSYYTNGCGLTLWNDEGSDVHDNVFDSTGDGYWGRGVQISRKDPQVLPENRTQFHHNIIRARELPFNQEYNGPVLGGCYGLQMERACNIDVYENLVEVFGDEADAFAFRMNNYHEDNDNLLVPLPGRNIEVWNNVFRSIRGEGSTFSARTCKFSRLFEENDIRIHDNTFISNHGWLGECLGLRGLNFINTTLKIEGDGEGFEPVEGIWSPNDTETANANRRSENLRFIDPIYFTELSETKLENEKIFNKNQSAADTDNESWFFISNDIPFDFGVDDAGKIVEVRLTSTNELVFTGTLDAEGKITILLDAMKMHGSTKTTFAYNVNVIG